ncbi:putative endonuclease [Ereboglobus sp. PH5-10]|uniref:YraN family protein n=1 Tax=Ereboglobus sp. PH5-10 TaxID=2940629 RepID=UPI002404C114|nr:YraN family protein [Ereboglobus sp. PH5-10]MDF9828306.1 putative endonuclease [Ereboglobus sp. PH5-10]
MISWLKQQWARLRGAATPARTEKQKHGAAGESAAARFLANERGMTILARNWRSPRDRRDEIDIICRAREGALVFVEVKTYQTARLLNGYEAVNTRKKTVLKRAAGTYLRTLGPRWRDLSYRLDVVVVERTDDGRLIPHHFENVPLFSKGRHI